MTMFHFPKKIFHIFLMMGIMAALGACHAPTPNGAPLSEDSLGALRQELQQTLSHHDAQIGVALLTDKGDSLTINNSVHYPLMSILKFHQALAVAEVLRQQQCPLSQKVLITSADVALDTYSPMKAAHPSAPFQLSFAELLTYTLQQSDNLACDVLFDQLISPDSCQRLLQQQTGITHWQMAYNEAEMQSDLQHCYDNWTTPFAAVQLLRHFHEGKITASPYREFLLQQMRTCQTGANKLAAGLPEGTPIGDKTGRGPLTSDGRLLANNDLGFITLPDGSTYYMAVFIKDGRLTPAEGDSLTALLSSRVYTHLVQHTIPSSSEHLSKR